MYKTLVFLLVIAALAMSAQAFGFFPGYGFGGGFFPGYGFGGGFGGGFGLGFGGLYRPFFGGWYGKGYY